MLQRRGGTDERAVLCGTRTTREVIRADAVRFSSIGEYEVVMMRLVLALTLLVTSIPVVAMAQGTPQERQACTRDAQRFCRKDLGNDGAVQGCLQMNRARLSGTCRKVFESHGM